MIWIKRLFCKHRWSGKPGNDVQAPGGKISYYQMCWKCGKIREVRKAKEVLGDEKRDQV